MKISKLIMKQAHLQWLTRTSFQQRFSLRNPKRGKNPGKTVAKLSETWQSNGNEVKQLTFTPGLNKWWEFCKMMTGGEDRRWKMVIILVFRKHLFTKASATPNPGKTTIRLLCRTVTVPNLKNRRSQILLNQNRGGRFSGCLFLFPLSSFCFSIF